MPEPDKGILPGELHIAGLFNEISEEELAPLAAHAERVIYRKGQSIFQEQELAFDFFILLEGLVFLHVVSITPSYDVTVDRLEPGDIIGEQSMAGAQRRNATATCMRQSEVIRVPLDQFEKFVQERPHLGSTIYRRLSGLMARRQDRLARRLLNMLRAQLFGDNG